MTEFRKYLYRFGLVLTPVVPLLFLTHGANALRIITYKVCLILIAVGIAELLWAIFFKPVYGKTEEMPDAVRQSVMLFRGILYAAVLLSCTLGL